MFVSLQGLRPIVQSLGIVAIFANLISHFVQRFDRDKDPLINLFWQLF